MSFHFDWYQATVLAPVPDLTGLIDREKQALGVVAVESRSGLHGYKQRDEYVGADGSRHLALMHGGSNPGVNVAGTGCLAESVAGLLRSSFPAHKVSRADVALDLSEEGLFLDLKTRALSHAAQHGIDTKLYSDPNNPEEGETLYVGGRTSPLRWRIYQKGFELVAKGRIKAEDLDANWVRVEAQVKPRTRDKARFATFEPVEMLGYALWSRQLADQIFEMNLEPIRRAQEEHRNFYFSAQYGVTSYGPSFMRVGYMDAVLAGHMTPCNATIRRHALAKIAEWLRAHYPNDRSFDPGFEVLEAIDHVRKQEE